MKTMIKVIGYLILAAVVVWVLVIFSANYIFTKKLQLACDGEWTVTKDKGEKAKEEKYAASESVVVTIVSYPFSKPFFWINTENDLLDTGPLNNGTRVGHVDEQKIMIVNRYDNDKGFTYKGVMLNRLTLNVVIDRKHEHRELSLIQSEQFKGKCKNVTPL